MKTNRLILLATLLATTGSVLQAAPLGTAFTYQGRLNDGSGPASGSFDFQFALYSTNAGGSQVGPALTNAAVSVSGGLFTTALDFGTNIFTNAARWLEISVRTNGGAAFNLLSPRQALSPTPQALYAATMSWSGLTGVPSGFADGTDNNTTYSAGLGMTLGGSTFRMDTNFTDARYWTAIGNSNTTPATNFLGSRDDQPVEFRVNNDRALRLEPHATSPNVIGGHRSNAVTAGTYGATIGGGGQPSGANAIGANYATIGGGDLNSISAGSTAAVIAGGSENTNRGAYAVVPGGYGNLAAGSRSFAAGNRAQALHQGAFVWADSTDAAFSSTTNNQFLIRASGGVGIGKTNPATALDVAGTVTATAFSGSGAALTSLNGGNVSSGTVAEARVASTITRDSEVLSLVLAADGAGSGLDADSLDGLHATNLWQLGGNAGTTAGTHFFGTSDNQPFELKVNGQRALRLEPGVPTPSVVVGHSSNTLAAGVSGAAILGGTQNTNRSSLATIAGGQRNLIHTNAWYGGILAGEQNTLSSNVLHAVIGGGFANGIRNGANASIIGAGAYNVVSTNANNAFIGGGFGNVVSNGASFAAIPGGENNFAAGQCSFAAGRHAQAGHSGSFVWGDSQNGYVASTTTNQFTIRAGNGVRITENAGSGRTIHFGERYRDNTVVAWARISNAGTPSNEFGVTSATNSATGVYDITVDAAAATAMELIPIAIAEVNAPPTNAALARLVTVNQTGLRTFSVYVTTGAFAPVNHQFLLMVTGR